MTHNEDSRVKIPALLHFLRLGYKYQSKKNANMDIRNNIFIDVFRDSIRRINNKDYDDQFLDSIIKEVADLTDNDKDKGQHFFNRLVSYTSPKLIDLKNFENNDFRVVTELTFYNDEEFRPDITILINGIPLGFIEVKKPNNQNGMQAEFSRMKYRMKMPQFRRFMNQFQILAFTNNMEYDDDARIKLQGNFYTTPNFEGTKYNNFREERAISVNEYLDNDILDSVLHDNNIVSIKSTPEFASNMMVDTPANSFITSLFSKERIIFFIRYGIVYVNSTRDGLQKHIIRYPQYFALQNLVSKIRNGLKRGIVWHTQGSGKTALSYFATNVLRDYFQEMNIITKFYFVVDRLDLLIQASDEFSSRGLTIAPINSKVDFTENIKSPVIVPLNATDGQYKETMNVVNIQKFSQDSTVDIKASKDIQRIYFLDEVHRGYKPRGTFLANLLGADKNGIFIGLTGTPLLKAEFKSTDIFNGGYIHKYYYNKSIADGYTLKIKKENVSTQFREDVRNTLKIKDGERIPSKDWETVTKSPIFVEKVCNYIVKDFKDFKENPNVNDSTLGCMIVTSSSEQAKGIKKWFDEYSTFKSALVLYDEENNKDKQEGFRGKRNKNTGVVESEYEGVVVYNMLLTGFDAPRLKKIYLLREIKEHSLLQTLARVNRPYKNMKYGYVVDFVDITEQYEATNQRYLEELKADIGDVDDATDVEDIFIDVKKVKKKIEELEGSLFMYMGNIENNLENFTKQIEHLDETKLRQIKSDLDEYRECYNELRMSHEDTSKIPIERLNKAFYEVTNRINIKVAERIMNDPDVDINDVDVIQLMFDFIKTGEVELEFSTGDDIIERVNKIKNAFSSNNDTTDPEYTKLSQRFKSIIQRFRNDSNSVDKIKAITSEMDNLFRDISILNSNNSGITSYYHGDDSCMRIHKRLIEKYPADLNDVKIRKIMMELIAVIDSDIKDLGVPPANIVIARLRKPIKKALMEQGVPEVSVRMADNIAMLFVDDKFKA